MAQDDIVNIDSALEEIEISQLFPEKPGAIIDKPYSGKRVGDSFKNFLVEDLGVPKNWIDIAVGRPGGFRERFYSPGRGYDPFGLPPMSPIQFRGFRELMEPTDYGSRTAREAGVTGEDTPFQISRVAAFLPADSYDTGVQTLIRNYYGDNFGVPDNFDYEFQREPYNKQVIYRDPTDNELKFVNPPGIDWANFIAGAEPLVNELGGALVGFGAGSLVGPKGSVIGTVGGEILASYLWRYNNLNQLANQGLLDPSYDDTKIHYTAMKDAGMTALFSLGGLALYKIIGRALGTGAVIPGLDEEAFVKAFDDLQATATTPEKQRVIETATVPEVMATQDLQPIIGGGLQAEIARAAGRGDQRAGKVVEKLEEGEAAKRAAVVSVLEDAEGTMPTKGPLTEELDTLQPETVYRKEELGEAMRREQSETVDPKIQFEEAQIQKARENFDAQLKGLTEGSIEPDVAINNLRELIKNVSKGKGDKAMPNTYKGFQFRLNKLVSDNKAQDKILDNVFELAKTSDRKFFQSFLNDPEFVDSKILLRNALKNKYKNMLQTDEAGRLVPMARDSHQKFLADNKNIIDDLFDIEDVKAFTDAENFARKLTKEVEARNQAINELQKQPWGASTDPEFIFKNTWTRQKEGITRTRKVKDIIGENQELSDEYRLMILNDMREQTGDFTGTKIVDYIDNYGAMLEQWFPKDVVGNLREYSNLIKGMKTKQGAVFDDPALVELVNKAARVYVGFFTAPGRALSATKQLLGIYQNSKFVNLLLDPKKYRDAIKLREVVEDPNIKAIVKGTAKTYGRETGLVSGFDEPEEGQIETKDPVLFGFEIDELEMNRGGEALMELKY